MLCSNNLAESRDGQPLFLQINLHGLAVEVRWQLLVESALDTGDGYQLGMHRLGKNAGILIAAGAC